MKRRGRGVEMKREEREGREEEGEKEWRKRSTWFIVWNKWHSK